MTPKTLFERLPVTRRCGACDLCCTAMSVAELKKPAGMRCVHLQGSPGTSCSIYADRPYVCAEFACMWRGSDTLLSDGYYPAKCGFVIALSSGVSDRPVILTVHPNPDFPDSWKQPRHRETFRKLAQTFNAIVVVGEHHLARHIFTPIGNEYTKQSHPEYFKDNGARIGAPETDFLPHHLTNEEMVWLLFGKP